jgi:uncharacterized protein (UPF0335 family)
VCLLRTSFTLLDEIPSAPILSPGSALLKIKLHRLAEATADRFFERATQLGAELPELKEDYRTIYQEFVNNGMPHKEVMKLVGLRRQSPRHRLLVDMMSMLSQFPAFKAQLFSPVAIPPQPNLPAHLFLALGLLNRAMLTLM